MQKLFFVVLFVKVVSEFQLVFLSVTRSSVSVGSLCRWRGVLTGRVTLGSLVGFLYLARVSQREASASPCVLALVRTRSTAS